MIRKYETSDLEALLMVWYRASLVGHAFLPEEFFTMERENIATQYLPNAETWVYEKDHTIIAFIAMIGNEIGGLFVHPDDQRQGIGTALINHIKPSRLFLEVNVFANNFMGKHFYQKYGFDPISQSTEPTTGQLLQRLRLEL